MTDVFYINVWSTQQGSKQAVSLHMLAVCPERGSTSSGSSGDLIMNSVNMPHGMHQCQSSPQSRCVLPSRRAWVDSSHASSMARGLK